MEFVASLDNRISGPAREATADLIALKKALDEAAAAGGKLGVQPEKAKPKTADEKAQAANRKNINQGIADAGKVAKAQAAADKASDKLDKEGEKKKAAIAKASKKRNDETGKSLWQGAKIAAAAGAVALAGFAAMAPTAIGFAGMAKLNAITARAEVSFRQLFKGVDASPLIRAYEKFTQNLSKTTVTGRALGDILTGAFNGVFRLLEKFEPLATAAFQGLILGALSAESSMLSLEIAFAPTIVAIDDFIKSSDGLELATAGGKVAFGALVIAATAAAAPIIAIGAAIAAVSEALVQFQKLSKEWDSNSSSQIWNKLKSDVGLGGDQGDKNRAQGITSGADYDKLHANDPKPGAGAKPAASAAAGADTGAALGAGIVKGMKDTEGAVTAAGGALAKAADKGVRDAAQIHSPSRLMREKGQFMGSGLEEGLDDSKQGVQDSAGKNLVPDVKGGSTGGGMIKGGAQHFHFDFSGLTSGNTQDVEQVVRRVINEELWKCTLHLGGANP